jgi:hypothetical protein
MVKIIIVVIAVCRAADGYLKSEMMMWEEEDGRVETIEFDDGISKFWGIEAYVEVGEG